jgi:tripartite-type tricarboxylate transporter receptor subunit TctC
MAGRYALAAAVLAIGLLAIGLGTTAAAEAQAYPSRPIKVIVP